MMLPLPVTECRCAQVRHGSFHHAHRAKQVVIEVRTPAFLAGRSIARDVRHEDVDAAERRR